MSQIDWNQYIPKQDNQENLVNQPQGQVQPTSLFATRPEIKSTAQKDLSEQDELSKSLEGLGFFEGWSKESELALQADNWQQQRLQIYHQIRTKQSGVPTEQQQLFLDDLSKKNQNYQKSRENESFFTKAARNTVGSFLPQMARLGTNVLRRGGEAAAIAASASAISGAGVAPISGSAFVAGSVLGGLEYGYQQSSLELYANLSEMADIDGNKIDHETRQTLSTLGGMAGTFLETVGFSQAVKIFPALNNLKNSVLMSSVTKALQNPTVAKAVGLSAVSFASAVGTEVLTEVGQENINIAAEQIAKEMQGTIFADQLDADTYLERNLDTAYETLKTVILPFAVGAGFTSRSNIKQVRQSQAKNKQINAIVQSIQNNQLAKDMPENAEQIIANIYADKPDLQTMYLPALDVYETLFQSDDGREIAKKLNLEAEQVADAIELNIPVAVDSSKALDHLFTTEQGKVFQASVKYDPSDLTTAEITAQLTELSPEQINSLVEAEAYIDNDLKPQLEQEQNLAILDEIGANFVQPLIEAGYSPNQAKQQARLLAANAERMAPVFGMTPKEYLDSRLEIRNAKTYKGQKGLYQDSEVVGQIPQEIAQNLPLQRAASAELALMQEFTKKFQDIWSPIAQNKDYGKEFAINVNLPTQVAEKWGNMWTYDKVIAVALNMGNEGNLKALMNGYNFTANDLEIITSYLNEDMLKAVQKTWDMLEELKPHIAKVYEEINGVPMSEVKANPIDFTLQNGQTISLKGGYYPLQFDPDLAERIQSKEDVENIINANSFIPNTPKTKNGMTMERTGTNLPPNLSMANVIGRHLTDSIKYATHTIPVKNIVGLVNNQSYKDEFVKTFGKEAYAQIIPWLKAAATVNREPIQGYKTIANFLAKRGSLYAMGLSLRTMLMQFTGIPNSLAVIGTANFFKGALTLISNKELSYNKVKELSPFMMARANNLDKTIADQLAGFDPNAHALRLGNKIITRRQYENACFALIQTADAMVAFPTWIGKYNAELDAGTSQQEAIAKADAAVVEAQGSGLAMDTTSLMREMGAW